MTINYRFDDAVAEIHLDDGKANVLRTEWFHEFARTLDRASKDGARAISIRGREGIFSGGLDTKWIPTLDKPRLVELIEAFGETMIKLWTSPIPTVAAISGHAIAGGCHANAPHAARRTGQRSLRPPVPLLTQAAH